MDPSFLLSSDQIQEQLSIKKLSMWTYSPDQKQISRSFMAKSFQAALDALNAMGAIAEQESHHPDFHLTDYRNLQVVLWTHKVGGVTESDLTLAALLDQQVTVDYSPKWLKEHPEAEASAQKKV
eukprot:CAMPEP_0198145398 /NCGR_PEP_ID=MMETSP1443-20131203/23197_1 /TAXON_ID=186043 /ORGANISM="Entomoneis sp., Strain CCMP2396" /LENGTH=123 /DNA_ID=CAMNT_0043809037 /DNA_START=201 /DNA_END=572 /DNA_ORIENTATION=-